MPYKTISEEKRIRACSFCCSAILLFTILSIFALAIFLPLAPSSSLPGGASNGFLPNDDAVESSVETWISSQKDPLQLMLSRDTSRHSSLENPCGNFFEHVCMRESSEAFSFSLAEQRSTSWLKQIISLETERKWGAGDVNIFYESCVLEMQDGSSKGHSAVLRRSYECDATRMGEAFCLLEGRIKSAQSIQAISTLMGMLSAYEIDHAFFLSTHRHLALPDRALWWLGQWSILSEEAAISSASSYDSATATDRNLRIEALAQWGSELGIQSLYSDVLSIEEALEAERRTPDESDFYQYASGSYSSSDIVPGGFSVLQSHCGGESMNWTEYWRAYQITLWPESSGSSDQLAPSGDVWAYTQHYFCSLNSLIPRFQVAQWKNYLLAALRFAALQHIDRSLVNHDKVQSEILASFDRYSRASLHPKVSVRYGEASVQSLFAQKSAARTWIPKAHPERKTLAQQWRSHLAKAPTNAFAASFCTELTWMHEQERIEYWFVDALRLADPERRAYVEKVIAEGRTILRSSIANSSSLGKPTREFMIQKLENIRQRIATPTAAWSAPADILHSKSPLIENMLCLRLDHARKLWTERLQGRDYEAAAMAMPLHVPNAYYDPSENSINLLPGILQFPFFEPYYPPEVTASKLVAILFHEIGHAIDHNGRHWDSTGRLLEASVQATGLRTQEKCLEEQYSGSPTRLGVVQDGAQTLNENIADHVGVSVALEWLKKQLEGLPDAEKSERIRRFFISYAQTWCSSYNVDEQRSRAARDVHSLPENRVNIPLKNCDDFARAFSCPSGSPMSQSRCTYL